MKNHTKNEKYVTHKQLTIAMMIFINGVIIIVNGAEGEKDIWMSLLIAGIVGVILAYLYTRILGKYPDKNLFQIIESVWGRVLGKVIILAYILFTGTIAILLFRNFSVFLKTVSLPDSSLFFITLYPTAILIYILNRELMYFIRFIEVIAIPFFITIAGGVGLLVLRMDIINVLPILENGMLPVFKGALQGVIFPFGELIIFTMIFTVNSERSRSDYFRIFKKSTVYGGVVLILFHVAQILVLGIERVEKYQYPSYAMFSRIELGDFFQRIEIFMGLIFILGDIVKLAICVFAMLNGVKYLFNIRHEKKMVVPLLAAIIMISFVALPDVMTINRLENDIWKYVAVNFQVVLPLLLYISILMKERRDSYKRQK